MTSEIFVELNAAVRLTDAELIELIEPGAATQESRHGALSKPDIRVSTTALLVSQ